MAGREKSGTWKREQKLALLSGCIVPVLVFGIKLLLVDLPVARSKQAPPPAVPVSALETMQAREPKPKITITLTGSEPGAVTLKVKTPFPDRYYYLVVETDGSSPFVQDGPLTMAEGAWQGSLTLGNATRRVDEFFVYVVAVRQPLPHGYPEVPRGSGVESSAPVRIIQKKGEMKPCCFQS
jgi:hypothetical protein